ncbi:hypothetical protein D3C74_356350 [compost metagenome]
MADSVCSESGNDSSAMSSETVNPIPASRPTGSRSRTPMPGARRSGVSLVTSAVTPSTPMPLPPTSPTMMPIATGWPIISPTPPPSTSETPAAKNAKIGSAIPAETGRTTCSYWCVREDFSPNRTTAGTVKPRSTPATVAWIPDAWTRAQTTNASGSRSHQCVRRRRTRNANSATPTSARPSGAQCSVSV